MIFFVKASVIRHLPSTCKNRYPHLKWSTLKKSISIYPGFVVFDLGPAFVPL